MAHPHPLLRRSQTAALDKRRIGRQKLLDVVKRAARGVRWYDDSSVQHTTLIERLRAVAAEDAATAAFYWLIVYGVIEFDDIHLSERGRLLLARLAE